MAVTQNGPKQKNRHLTLETPLGADVLVLRRLDGHEKLSMPFRLELDAISTDPAITHKDILGQNVTVTMDLADDKKRYFNGFVSRFELHGYDGQFAHYRAVVVPWLWFLTRTTDCRIFQDKSIPDIIQGIFREHGFTDCEDALSGSYEAFEYVTQYRETDFDFVSRLMEQEGIYYFFRHEEHKHTLVLADSYDAHQSCPGYEIIPFYPPDSQKAVKEDYVWDWQTRQAVRPGTFALNDYDFTAPKKKLRTAANITRDYEYADYEMYDYPGGYTDKGVGNQYSQARIEERQTDFDTCQGQGNVRGLLAGGLTSLTKHPGEVHNREYLLTAVTHHVESDSMETGRNEAQDRFYSCEFDLIDAKTQFRPPLATPKGIVRGPQTAVVVGKSGETVWTDKYGRVKVQFHWDREGQNNEKSSCWVRVSQLWAGKNWGGMHIPHIGQEVIVDFLEGDPDRPIITGRVYNADNMPPEELPTQKTKSFIRDYGDNEMVWEGKEGEQFIRIDQKCGNILFMNGKPGAEGIVLRDKCGNQISMDSASGTMRLTSPTHNSTIGLGNSTYKFTKSDSWDVGYGLKGSVFGGAMFSVGLGIKGDAFVGTQMSATLGAKMSYTLANQLEMTRGNRVTYSKERLFGLSDDGHVQMTKQGYIGYGQANMLLAAGGGEQSQLYGDETELVISYQPGQSVDLAVPDAGPAMKGAMASLTAAATHAIASLATAEEQKKLDFSNVSSVQDINNANKAIDKQKENSEMPLTHATLGAAQGVLGLVSASYAMKGFLGMPEPTKHTAPSVKVELSKKGATISAGSTEIELAKDKNITIKTKTELNLDARNINIDTGTVNIKGGISQGNLSVKK